MSSIPLLLLILSAIVAKTFAQTCTYLPISGSDRLSNPCVGVVNYKYYTPAGQTVNNLIAKVHQKLGGPEGKFKVANVEQGCQKAAIRNACLLSFLECSPGVIPTNNATFTTDVYDDATKKMPFRRPRLNVCTTAVAACAASQTFARASGIAAEIAPPSGTSCSTLTTLYNGVDTANTYAPDASTVATDGDSSFTSASGSKETYTSEPDAPCAGLVNEVYIPAANKLNPIATPIQPPGVVQGLVNGQLNTLFGNLKTWIDEECMYPLKQAVCNAAFMNVETQTMTQIVQDNGLGALVAALTGQGVQNAPVLLPQYPSYQVCDNFQKKCAKLIESVPTLYRNCNATTPAKGFTIRNFPAARQQITNTTIAGNYVKFRTNPNQATYLTAAYQYEKVCPPGYVIPEHPEKDGVIWVGASGCAVACNSAVWTPGEWSYLKDIAARFPVASILVGIICMLFIIYCKDWENSYHVFIYTFLCCIASVASAHAVGYGGVGYDRNLCYDNAIQADQDNTNGPCVAQGIIIVYTFLGCCATILMLSFYWVFKTTSFAWLADTKAFYVFQFMWIFLLPIIPTVYAAANDWIGYNRSNPYCFIKTAPYAPEHVDVAATGLPVLIVTIFTHAAMFLHDIYLLFRRCCCGREHPEPHKHPNYALRWVVALSFLIFVPFMVSRGLSYTKRDDYYDSFREWTLCVFKNWDGTSSYEDVCGRHADNRINPALVRFTTMVLTSSNVIVCPTYMLAYVAYNYFWPNPTKPAEEAKYENVESGEKVVEEDGDVQMVVVEKTEEMQA